MCYTRQHFVVKLSCSFACPLQVDTHLLNALQATSLKGCKNGFEKHIQFHVYWPVRDMFISGFVAIIIISPHRSWWNIGPPITLSTWLYFERWLLSHATYVLSPQVLTSLCAFKSVRSPSLALPLQVPPSRVVLATCPSGLLSTWPIHPHVRSFISLLR